MTNSEPASRFLRACQRLPVDATPVWLMRQAGRYMAEYRTLRAKHDMLEMISTPALAAEVTLQPIDAFDLDAAIIFADILPPLIGMGLDLEFVPGKGPVIHNPISSPEDINRLETPPAEEKLSPTLEAIKIVTKELEPSNIPLIGFAGAPFTLASYAIEGGGSKDYARTKALMYSEPGSWVQLMDKLVTVQADYLRQEAYQRFVAPFNTRLFDTLKQAAVPVINFSTGTYPYLEDVAACGGEVIGVDFRMPLGAAWRKIGFDRAIQGNLDPATLLAPWSKLQKHIDRVLESAAGRPGHIFNLGHGLHKTTPVENVRRLADYVHEQTGK
jgi:uroporphyrinogen decarboxylase